VGDRSVKKGPFVRCCDDEAVEKLIKAGKSTGSIKTYYRDSTILPKFIGFTFLVHDGRRWVPVHINDNMVGHKLGEFVLTRTFRGHAADKKTKK